MSKALLHALRISIFPGGLVFLAALMFLRPNGLPHWWQGPVSALPYLALTFGLVFGWYFASPRTLFSLVNLACADQALAAWPLDHDPASVSNTIFAASSLLLPLNFLGLSLMNEGAVSVIGAALRVLPFLLQAVAVWWLCDLAHDNVAMTLTTAYIPGWSTAWTPIAQPGLLAFLLSILLLAFRFALRRRPMDGGAAWALAAGFVAYHGTQLGWAPDNFFAAGGFIVFFSLVQEKYQDAYRDQLTGISGRLAYEEAAAQLGKRYAVAVMAIDQLKVYAGAHGKPVIEQILRLTATKVQAACHEGRVFRVSGEELVLLYARQSAWGALVELEQIRKTIESTSLVLYDACRVREMASSDGTRCVLSITASIGVADSSMQDAIPAVVTKAAYRALYEAKAGGGNAVKRGGVTNPSFRPSRRHPITA